MQQLTVNGDLEAARMGDRPAPGRMPAQSRENRVSVLARECLAS